MVIAGGLERMTFEVLDAMRQKGVASHAIVNGWENFRITPLAEDSGASWSTGPYWYPLTRRHLTPWVVLKMLTEIVLVSADLLRVSRRVRPTHVLLPDIHATLRNLPALVWLRVRGVRIIARLGTAPSAGRFYRHLWRRVIDPVVDRFVANSEFTRRELIAHGVAGDKIETIENTLPRGRRRAAPASPTIRGRVVYVGQIIPGKGVAVLIDAIGLMRGRGIDATLDIVGTIDGWESPAHRGHGAELRDRASRPDVAGAIHFLGHREDVPALLGRASVHCCPSLPELREGFGLVVLEAKIAGVPSVVTPSGNLPEMIEHRRDGWLAARADAEALAEGLQYFLTNPEARDRAGRAAVASAARYNEHRFASAWSQVLSAPGQPEYSHAR
jgi:glycosyltransferase involved in cell wall biosynthesis